MSFAMYTVFFLSSSSCSSFSSFDPSHAPSPLQDYVGWCENGTEPNELERAVLLLLSLSE